jgi:glycosyltransferase involved in cell wall biosynthesis
MTSVSVVIPTFNRKDYVQEAIESVLSQTFTDYEIIVVDDGSTDCTGEVLSVRFGPLIHYVWQENQGESVARNQGVKLSQGEYIALLDSDDLWEPQKLEKQVAALESSQSTILVFTSSWRIDAASHKLGDAPTDQNIHQDQLTIEALCLYNIMGSAVSTAMIRRDAFNAVEGFDPSIRYGEDWDLWLRLRLHGSFRFLNEPLACKREHAGSQWHNPRAEIIDQRLSDHLLMLEKFFSTSINRVPKDLYGRAKARAYGLVALQDYLIGRTDQGMQRLKKAIQLDYSYRSELQYFPELLKFQFLDPNLISYRSVASILEAAIKAYREWPDEFPLTNWRKGQIIEEICTHLFFLSYQNKDYTGVRYCMPYTIRYNPALLHNCGFWSIVMRVFLYRRVKDLLGRVKD